MRTLLAIAACFALLLPANIAKAEGQKYRLVLNIGWSKATHPFEWPEGCGHMSDLIGATHNTRYVMFADGRTASSGLKLIAENGRSRTMKAELAEADRRRRIGQVFEAEGLKGVPGIISTEFTATDSNPYVSFVTMIAPSPDWFTGATGVALKRDGEWVNGLSITLRAWDSGTDSGPTFISKNMETQPAESTRLVANPHFLTQRGLLRMGTARIEKVD